jgi:hypothetical protein
MAQAINDLATGHLVIIIIGFRSGLHPFQGRRQCAGRTALSPTRLYRLASAVVAAASSLAMISSTELQPTTEEAMQSALDVQFTLLTSLSATAEHVPHTALVLRCAEATASAPQLEAHLQVP